MTAEKRRAELVRDGALSVADDDSALALHVYLHEGAAGLARLEGAFLVAVWDGRSGELLLVNDRYGLYPHYYTHCDGRFCFAPEMKAILGAPGIHCTLDLTAVAQYTRFQQLLGERTWAEGLWLLAPATILRFTPAEDLLRLERYWDWDAIRPHAKISFDEAAEECVRLFQRAIDGMTQPPHKLGVYLSGGMDGRTILGYINPQIPVTAVTFGAAGCRDVEYGTALARRAGRPHIWFPFDDGRWVLEHSDLHLALTDGMHSWVNSHGMSTLEGASQAIDVHLSGWDGGTIMGGHIDDYETDHWYRHAPNEETLTDRLFHGFCRVFTWPGLTDAEARMLGAPPAGKELMERARDSFAVELARTAHYPQPYRSDYFYLLQRVRRSTQSMIVFQRSMLEVRCPFFDYDLVSFLYGLPESVFATPALHRAILTRRAPGLAMIPYDKDDLLPHSGPMVRGAHFLVQKAKRAVNKVAGPVFPARPRLYADYENYLRTDLRNWGEGILFDLRSIDRGLFDPVTVRALWDHHQRGHEVATIGKIAPLITIELVLRTYFDDSSAAPAFAASAAG